MKSIIIIIIVIIIIIGHKTRKSSEYKNFKTKYSEQYPQVRKINSDIQVIVQSNEKLD